MLKLPIEKGKDNLMLRFESPIVFRMVGDGWTRFGDSYHKEKGHRAILFRVPKIVFYWVDHDTDF